MNAKSRASSRIRDGTVTRLTASAEVDVGTVPSAARVDDGTLVVTVGEAHAVAWILGSVEDIEPQRTRRTQRTAVGCHAGESRHLPEGLTATGKMPAFAGMTSLLCVLRVLCGS